MAMYEVAYEFKGLVDYMVFSEEVAPGDGDPYDTILAALVSNPTMTSKTLSSTIVDKYDDYYATNYRGATTKSAIDMSQIAALDTKILALSAAVQADVEATTLIQAARTATQNYAYTSNHDLYDICSYLGTRLADGTAKTLCNEIMALINSLVINNKINDASEVGGSHGLAIYLPTDKETNTSDLSKYASLACNKTRSSTGGSGSGTWGAFVEYLITGIGGGNLQYASGGFSLKLEWKKPDDTACDADLDLYIWEPEADWSSTGNGEWYAPWMGRTSPNGFFSQDSADSGVAGELFVANNQVYWGDFQFVVNYYENGATCSQAKARLWLYHPDYQKWLELTPTDLGTPMSSPSPQTMDLSNPYVQGCSEDDLACLDTYSDWWAPDMVYQARFAGYGPVVKRGKLPFGSKKNPMIFRYGKGMRIFSK
jgi:hypothetical protein